MVVYLVRWVVDSELSKGKGRAKFQRALSFHGQDETAVIIVRFESFTFKISQVYIMRQTTISNSDKSTVVDIVVNDIKTTITFSHELIPEPLALQLATAIAQIPSSYERCKN